MPGSRQLIFLVARETLPKEHLPVIRSERQIFSLALLTGRDYNGLDCFDPLVTPNPTQNRCGWFLFAYGEYKLD